MDFIAGEGPEVHGLRTPEGAGDDHSRQFLPYLMDFCFPAPVPALNLTATPFQAKSLIPDFSADTQAVLNNVNWPLFLNFPDFGLEIQFQIVSAYENGADTPTKTLVEQVG